MSKNKKKGGGKGNPTKLFYKIQGNDDDAADAQAWDN